MRTICQYILDLYKSSESKPLYRTKLMVVGFESVGKTTILDCLFPMSGYAKTQGDVRKTLYWFELVGKYLGKYKVNQLKQVYKEYVLNEKQWEVETKDDCGIILTPKDKNEKKIEIYYDTEKLRDAWLERFKRILVNVATHGIEIQNFHVDHPLTESLESKLEIAVWDFAGQHDYYNNHHYFLSTKTVFLVLWKIPEEDEGLKSLDFWLKSLYVHLANQSHASGKPLFSVIVVGTFLDQDLSSEKGSRGKNQRREKVTEMVQKNGIDTSFQYFEVSCSTLENIDKLKDAVVETALSHAYMGEKAPTSYLAIEKAIEELRERHKEIPIVQIPQVLEHCRSFSSLEFDHNLIIRGLKLLHEWGRCVYFDYPEELSTIVVLKPEFLTKEVLSGLFRADLVSSQKRATGIINHSDFHYFWPRYRQITPTLLSLLEQFEVCFRLKETETDLFENQKTIIPNLLPEKIPQTIEQRMLVYWPIDVPPGKVQIERTFSFNVLPIELVSRLLVRLHPYIHERMIWRRGVLLRKNDKYDSQHVTLSLLRANVVRNQFSMFIRGRSVPECLDLISFVSSEIENCSRKYPGVKLRMAITSPHLRNSSIGLDLILEDSKRPLDQRTLVCTLTHYPVFSEELLVKGGFMVASEC